MRCCMWSRRRGGKTRTLVSHRVKKNEANPNERSPSPFSNPFTTPSSAGMRCWLRTLLSEQRGGKTSPQAARKHILASPEKEQTGGEPLQAGKYSLNLKVDPF
ncbi:hypothetical protein AAFF_G00257870 [Aldrovandia affinis]|uniref:Uncharacterized protein n=1 Tax=Aldrovandia affinis TaxID=143900 RepID=A0AAD7WTE3_9TELE|nr:hypothetical protein AAFF_G00257870 [Aldrovandia affinis]